MKTASIAEIESHFGAFVAATGEGSVVVTKNGRPVALLTALTDEDDLDSLRLAYSPGVQKILSAARKRYRQGKCLSHDEFWKKIESDYRSPRKTTKPKRKARG